MVGDIINHHPDIAKISFTDSTAVGKHIIASGAHTLKRVTLEPGGKSPTLILDDADTQQAVALAIESGRVLVNTLEHEPQAPFGGFRQSGLGREMGKWGMQAYLEPKTVMVG